MVCLPLSSPCCLSNTLTGNPTEGHLDSVSSYILNNDDAVICKENQRQPNQKPNFPRLKASPGSFIRASWLENGHTTNPGDTDNPGYDAGPVYYFGTTKPKADTTLGEVRKWPKYQPEDGNMLLGRGPFDDTMCAELGSEGKPLGAPRWKAGGGGACKGQFQIPEDLEPGTTYTVYWVWDFSKKVGTLNPDHFEWYSSCMDIDIIPGYISEQQKLDKLRRSAKFRGRL